MSGNTKKRRWPVIALIILTIAVIVICALPFSSVMYFTHEENGEIVSSPSFMPYFSFMHLGYGDWATNLVAYGSCSLLVLLLLQLFYARRWVKILTFVLILFQLLMVGLAFLYAVTAFHFIIFGCYILVGILSGVDTFLLDLKDV